MNVVQNRFKTFLKLPINTSQFILTQNFSFWLFYLQTSFHLFSQDSGLFMTGLVISTVNSSLASLWFISYIVQQTVNPDLIHFVNLKRIRTQQSLINFPNPIEHHLLFSVQYKRDPSTLSCLMVVTNAIIVTTLQKCDHASS